MSTHEEIRLYEAELRIEVLEAELASARAEISMMEEEIRYSQRGGENHGNY